MNVKILLFITILFAAASIGLALPPKAHPSNTTDLPTPKALPIPKASSNTTAPPTPKSLPSSLNASPDVEQLLAAVPPNALGDLSKECQSTLLKIITSPEFLKCIPVQSLVPLLPLVTDPSLLTKFLADPVHNYPPVEKPILQSATLFCPAPKCSDKGVADAIAAIQDGCKDDLSKKNPLIVGILDAAVFYSPIKDIGCFKFGKTFCWDESILTAISLPPSPFVVTGDKFVDAIAVADPTAICTKCNKAIVNDFLNFIKKNDPAKQILASIGFDDKKLALFQTGAAVKCGAQFEDGQIPK
ncbi:hypothetical protein RCL_jg29667.t1 [Rhizophagus clarus]|nr:hypothetical protein RCL_jg29667.t1 [Rhizophagus clarus]